MINLKRFIVLSAIYIKAARAPFLTASLISVLLGTAISWSETGKFDLLTFLMILAGVGLLHLAANLNNDYFDHLSGNDRLNTNLTPFSGGSRVIQKRLLTPKAIFAFSLVCFFLSSMIGLWLNYKLGTNVILLLGILGVFLGFFYTALPLKIGYRGFGELIIGFCCGPLVIIGSYYSQTTSFSQSAFWASIPIGILVTLILFINEFPDYVADKKVAKNTLVVLLGKKKAILLFNALLWFTYVIIAAGIIFRSLPWTSLLIFATLPIVFKIMTVSRKNFNKINELLPASAATIKLHLMIGLLISASFLLSALF